MIVSCYCFKIPILTLKTVLSPPCTLTSLRAMTVDFPLKYNFLSLSKISFHYTLTSKSGQWISKIWFCFLLSSWTGFVFILPMPSPLFCTCSAMHFTWNHSKNSKEPQVLKTISCLTIFHCLEFCFHQLNHRQYKMSFSELTN